MAATLRLLGPFAIILAVWWLGYLSGGLPPQLLPSPLAVLEALTLQLASQSFWVDLGVSIGRVFVGFTLSAVVAVPVGLLMAQKKGFKEAFTPVNNWTPPITVFLARFEG